MAEIKISDMTPGAALDGSELFEMTQSGGTFSTDADTIKAWCSDAPAFTGSVTSGGALAFTAVGSGISFKQGANGRTGTFVANGVTPVTVTNSSISADDLILISLSSVGGTVGAVPAVKTITPSTGFTVAATASDTSTYRYVLIRTAA